MVESDPILSLLSLSLAAAQSDPLPTEVVSQDVNLESGGNGAPNTGANGGGVDNAYLGRPKTRRLSSASSARRRIQDAREATIRNSHAQNMAGLNNATATLSLGSPPSHGLSIADLVKPSIGPVNIAESTPTTGRNRSRSITTQSLPASSPLAYHMNLKFSLSAAAPNTNGTNGANGTNGGTVAGAKITTLPNGHQAYNGTLSVGALEEVPPPYASVLGSKKKGTIFRCESCSKVYRHPSCLIKHRWEHSPHWKEANKFLLSKHQQVQLLEAAAILSHITPSAARGEGGPATSLPEDRSLWPSYLANSVPAKPFQEGDDDDIEDGEAEDEEVDVIAEDGGLNGGVDDFEMEMEFDNPSNARFRDSAFFVKGPLSSSVPAGATFPTTLTQGSFAGNTGANGTGGAGHHRNRSRSRSISKSIHTHVIKSVRGHARRSSGRIGEKEREDGSTPSVPANGVITTLRPGLIGVPTGSYHRHSHSHSKERESLPRSIGSPLSPRMGTAGAAASLGGWASNSLMNSLNPLNGNKYTSPSPGVPSPINLNPPSGASPIPAPGANTKPNTNVHTRSSRGNYPPSSYPTSASLAALSLPRSSVRSSTGFTETDVEGPEMYDELWEGSGSGSDAKGVSPSPAPAYASARKEVVGTVATGEWDGMEMEMEM